MARIAFIDVTVTVSYGGLQTVVWKLAEVLARAKHEITVFGGAGSIAPPKSLGNVAVRTFPFRPRDRVLDLGSRFQRTVERMTFARHARAAVIEGEYDWVIIDKPFDFFWPWIVRRQSPSGSKTRFAFVSGGTDFIPFDRTLVRRVDALLSCSYFNAWQLRTRYRKRYPIVIYNGVDVNQFTPRTGATLRAQLGVPSETVLFAFAGRLVGWKGMSVALRALAEPALRDIPARLLVIGEGPDQPKLKELANTLAITERVIFHDPVPHDRLPDYYAAADVGFFPSIGDEAFGITIAEAMSCSKPVVGSYIGGIPEVVGNEGSCGVLVPPGDPRVLAQAMRALALDPARRADMGRAARARIEQHYTWGLVGQRMLTALGLS